MRAPDSLKSARLTYIGMRHEEMRLELKKTYPDRQKKLFHNWLVWCHQCFRGLLLDSANWDIPRKILFLSFFFSLGYEFIIISLCSVINHLEHMSNCDYCLYTCTYIIKSYLQLIKKYAFYQYSSFLFLFSYSKHNICIQFLLYTRYVIMRWIKQIVEP